MWHKSVLLVFDELYFKRGMKLYSGEAGKGTNVHKVRMQWKLHTYLIQWNLNVIPPIITIIAVIKILIVKILFKFKNNSGIYSLMIWICYIENCLVNNW